MRREWLVKFRGERTQEEVAKHCNIHRGHYSLIETGDRTPSVTVAKRIAAFLGFEWTLFFEHNCVDTLQNGNAVETNSA
ncbi:helix-turn-helix transcriptional regulator [Alicyclobacillus fodiniaquatilis]|uniref:Helix-turn-helix transcriptional regulator n=1 Tax=Alicyclobacillus fodiniaquatilis TaxID=1661150 RepID=A0ABW4JGK2_9BACL